MPNLLLVGAVLVFLAASFRVEFFYSVLYLFVLTGLLARLWVWRAWRNLDIRREFESHVFLGETATLRLRIRNSGRLPIPWVRVEDRLPARLTPQDAFRAVVSVLPRETRTLEYQVVGQKRGYYPIGPLQVELGDVFGFYTRAMATATPSYLTVYPKILSLDKLGLPSRSPFGSLKTHQIIYEDPSRVVGVRDYMRGDSLRKINWKVSAATGRLQVTKYEPAITLDTLLFLNLNTEEYDLAYADGATELAIVVAASLAHHLAELRQPVGLICNGRDPAAALDSGPDGAPEEATEMEPPAGDGASRAGAPQPWDLERPRPGQIDRRGLDELGFALPSSRALARERPSIAIPPGKGRAHLMRILEALARVQAQPSQPLASLLRQQAVRLPWGSTIAVITWGRALGLVDALVALRKSGFNVVVVLVRFGFRDVFPAELAAMGFQVHEVRSEEDVTLFDQKKVAV
jgi:uncharacterized protein (DUF58 family)